jgi:hypothetical protein
MQLKTDPYFCSRELKDNKTLRQIDKAIRVTGRENP